MHGKGEEALVFGQPRRRHQEPSGAAGQVREPDLPPPLAAVHHDARVAVGEAGLAVVAGHDDRPADVERLAVEHAAGAQAALHEPVEPAHAERPAPVRAQDAPRREGVRRLRRRAQRADVLVPLVRASRGELFEFGCTRQRPPFGLPLAAVVEGGQRRRGVAVDDRVGQEPDAPVPREAVALGQAYDARRQLRAAPGGAQVAEHGAGLHRRELVGIAEQDEPARVGQPGDKAVHQQQVHHRALVHQQRIQAQIGPGQQPVDGAGHGREVGERRHARAQAALVELCRDRFLQPRRRLAGRRHQPDAVRPGNAEIREQRDQPRRERGLAGAGPAGDDAQPPLDGGPGGGHRGRVGGGAEHAGQRIAEGARGQVGGPGTDARGEPRLGFEQAVQVEPIMVQHQRT